MSKVETISNRLEYIFKQMRGLSNEEYEKVVLNMELLKKQYYIPKFKKKNMKLFEHISFKDFICETQCLNKNLT